ncbi:MAG: cadmium-containing carbonic anhydrase [Actinomycetaceae bacterium]|nr:cadmium-containing carbonic anhydrase [Actinomycetaceae bacterium]
MTTSMPTNPVDPQDAPTTTTATTEVPTTFIAYIGKLSEGAWPGPLTSSELPHQRFEENLEDYFVKSNPESKTRCIDGRHDPDLDEQHLGPQAPAGAPGSALAYRLGIDEDDLTRGTFKEDAETMIETYMRLGINPGGHRDAGDHQDGQTVGCGALDGLQEVLNAMTNPGLVEDHKRLVKLILGDAFVRDDYLKILGAAMVLQSRSVNYFAARGEILDLLEKKAPGSVSILEGDHREGVVIVNLVEGTTLASNRFADDHEGVQAFGYDFWRSEQLAHKIFPLPRQSKDRRHITHARVMLTVATLMALTDGSLPIFIRCPLP